MFVRKHHYMNCALMAPTDIATLQGWSGVANVIATLLIGVVAALVAIQSKRIAAASILPFLVVDEELREDSLEYNITNVGLGPAIIKQIEVTYPAEPYILRVVKEQVESDRQQLQGFLQSDAVTRQAGGRQVIVGVAQPLDDWAKAALMHMPVMGQDALQLLDDGCEYWFDRLGAQPTTKSYSHTSPPDGHFPLPSLRTKAAKGYVEHVSSPPLQKLVGWTMPPKGKLTPFYTAKAREHPPANPPPDKVWQAFKLKLLGHINGVQLTIKYADAMGNEVRPLQHTFSRDFYEYEVDLLREAVQLQSREDLDRIVDVNSPDLQANIVAARAVYVALPEGQPQQPIPAGMPGVWPKWMGALKRFLQLP